MEIIQLKELNEEQSNNEYVFQTMLTCIGNKRKLVKYIKYIANDVKNSLNKNLLKVFDGFCGSTVVSRELLNISNEIYTNDLEKYSYYMAKCFIDKPNEKQKEKIYNHIKKMNKLAKKGPYIEGIISKLYAPKDSDNIQEDERCFYTRENALIIDTLRDYIDKHVEKELKYYCLVPLITKASIHTNTAGVFKGFYKDGNKGCFGGKGRNALSRILKPIKLEPPIWLEEHNYKVKCMNGDINYVIDELPNDLDLIYLDPPYNQHPYGSNYFMLNVIIDNKMPEKISKVSGIPASWNKSNYNKKSAAIKSMNELVNKCIHKSKYVLISYNNEGIIPLDEWDNIFKDCNIKKYEIIYDTFKGCRNLKNRKNKVIEIMYLVSKKN